MQEKWPEKHDCAILSSKGYATGATRDLLDLLGETDEEITFFCVHDADGYGTRIKHAIQEETDARPACKFKVENLGLEYSEAIKMGLTPDEFETPKGGVSVGDYVDAETKAILQTKRIELNAMSSPQFLKWLDDKTDDYTKSHEEVSRKLIPPTEVITDELKVDVRSALEKRIHKRILTEANADDQVQDAYNKLESTIASTPINDTVETVLQKDPTLSWRKPIEDKAADIVEEYLS